jgi:NAD(P)-dependent dehydrogenase (short-subunit alcohol dehydrogenase family)
MQSPASGTEQAAGRRRSVVVTGASTGIGRAIAARLVAQGYRVFGSVRTAGDGERLVAELGPAFTPLQFDVTDHAAVELGARRVADVLDGQPLVGLVNNAGIAVPGPVLHLPLGELERQLAVNVTGVVGVTQAFAPLLGAGPRKQGLAGKPGRIVNISSVSGRIAYPFMGAYAASKFALEALSDALRRELIIYGVDVIVIQPGAVQSEIWGKEPAFAQQLAETDYGLSLQRYRRFASSLQRKSMPADVVAATVQRALEARRPRTRYTLANRPLTGWWLPRLLPTRTFDRIVARAMGLTQPPG